MKKLLLSLSLCAYSLAATYAAHNGAISQDGKQIGEIIIGTEYERSGGNITFTAWRPQGSKIVYGELGVLSVSAILEPDAKVKVLQTKEDDYENEWEQVEITAQFSADGDSQTDPILAGKDLFEERCGTCHALHSTDEFSKNVWPSTVKSMQDNSGLDDNEYYQVVKYLQRVAPGDDE